VAKRSVSKQGEIEFDMYHSGGFSGFTCCVPGYEIVRRSREHQDTRQAESKSVRFNVRGMLARKLLA
jgi:hypothetical protein